MLRYWFSADIYGPASMFTTASVTAPIVGPAVEIHAPPQKMSCTWTCWRTTPPWSVKLIAAPAAGRSSAASGITMPEPAATSPGLAGSLDAAKTPEPSWDSASPLGCSPSVVVIGSTPPIRRIVDEAPRRRRAYATDRKPPPRTAKQSTANPHRVHHTLPIPLGRAKRKTEPKLAPPPNRFKPPQPTRGTRPRGTTVLPSSATRYRFANVRNVTHGPPSSAAAAPPHESEQVPHDEIHQRPEQTASLDHDSERRTYRARRRGRLRTSLRTLRAQLQRAVGSVPESRTQPVPTLAMRGGCVAARAARLFLNGL